MRAAFPLDPPTRADAPPVRHAGGAVGAGPPLPAARARSLQLTHAAVLSAVAVMPAMGLVLLGEPALGARALLAAVAGLGVLVANRAPGAPLALVLATLPALMLLRNLVLYNGVTLLLFVALGWYALRDPAPRALLGHRRTLILLSTTVTYWLVSWILTTRYYDNLRLLELGLAALGIAALAARPELFREAGAGMIVTMLSIGGAMLSLGERLGYARVAGVTLGNPISFGLPVAFLLLLVHAGRGRALGLDRRPKLRLACSVVLALALVLSTSRGALLVAAVSLSILAIFDRSSRRSLALASIGGLAVAWLTLRGARGDVLRQWGDRTFSSERSLANRTSGRSDQWLLFPQVLADAPPWGFGPGRGAEIYARYSLLDPRVTLEPGKPMAWHSLYLHVGVEAGVLGLAALCALTGSLLKGGLRAARHARAPLALTGTIGFTVVGLSVSGIDGLSGLFLGLALLPPPAMRPRGGR